MPEQEDIIFHKPVLVEEVLHYLNVRPNKVYLDVTFGSGGHTRAILKRDPTCNVVALDWDQTSLDTYGSLLQEEFGDRLMLVWGNFASLYRLVKKIGIAKFDGILADFGTSQMQIFQKEGFSVHRDTPLDMRMSRSHHKETAADILAHATEKELRDIFWTLGEERHTKKIVSAIIQERKIKPIKTTGQLARLVQKVVPMPSGAKRRIHPATQVFQALRIYVNKELDNITSFLSVAVTLLNSEGRLVCISFHSLEDRLVKRFFKDQADLGKVRLLTPKAVVPTEEEVLSNRASRSSKLRAIEYL